MIPDLLKKFTPYVVDSLPTREREALNAVFWEQISVREIARRNGEDEASTRRTLKRAMKLVKERLEALERSYDEWPD